MIGQRKPRRNAPCKWFKLPQRRDTLSSPSVCVYSPILFFLQINTLLVSLKKKRKEKKEKKKKTQEVSIILIFSTKFWVAPFHEALAMPAAHSDREVPCGVFCSSLSDPPPTFSPCSRVCGSRDTDLCGLHPQPPLPSGFPLSLASGLLCRGQRTGREWGVFSGVSSLWSQEVQLRLPPLGWSSCTALTPRLLSLCPGNPALVHPFRPVGGDASFSSSTEASCRIHFFLLLTNFPKHYLHLSWSSC